MTKPAFLALSLLVLMIGCPWNQPVIVLSPWISFDLQDTLKTITVSSPGHWDSKSRWRILVSDLWLHVSPMEGSFAEGGHFNHEVRVDHNLPAGQYRGRIGFEVTGGDTPINDSIMVYVRTGSQIKRFVIESDSALDSLFACSDMNARSEEDYWGVQRTSWEPPNRIWCAGRGIHFLYNYDNDMDAWMVLRHKHFIDIKDYQRVHIGFRIYGRTASVEDYLMLHLLGWDGRTGPGLRIELYSNMMSIAVDSLGNVAVNDSLRFGFLFHSDPSEVEEGYYLRDIMVFGDPREE